MIHLELQPEIEAQLAAEAHAHGLQTDRYIESLLAAHLADDQGLREGLDDIAAGRTRSARDFFTELHDEYGIRG